MKNGMIFLAKMNAKQNDRLMDVLAGLTEEQMHALKPSLPGGSIAGAVDRLISNALFTQRSVHLDSMKFHELSAPYVEDTGTGFASFDSLPSFADAGFEKLSQILHLLSTAYVAAFESCDNAEITDASSGLAPFDFMTKGLVGAMYTRGQILYALSEVGITGVDLMEGPLVD